VNSKLPLSLFGTFAVMMCSTASATSETSAIAAFDRTFAGINDYTCILHSHEVNGTRSQDRVYQYSFMKPHYLKTLVVEGDAKGAGVVWIGGDIVSAHPGGILYGVHVKLSVRDPRTISLHGVTIPEGLLPGIIDDYRTIPGKLTQTDGGRVGSVETERVDLKVADPSSNHNISEQIVYLSKETHWPVRQILYSGSQIVLDESVDDLKVNVGLAPSDFPF
jgi:outer membrane lipoprotein-sorting protein